MIYSYVWLFARLTGGVSETFQEVLRTFSKYLSISENFWVYDLKFIISMILCLLDQQIFWNHFSQIIWINSRLLQLFFLSNPILFSSSFFAGVKWFLYLNFMTLSQVVQAFNSLAVTFFKISAKEPTEQNYLIIIIIIIIIITILTTTTIIIYNGNNKNK